MAKCDYVLGRNQAASRLMAESHPDRAYTRRRKFVNHPPAIRRSQSLWLFVRPELQFRTRVLRRDRHKRMLRPIRIDRID